MRCFSYTNNEVDGDGVEKVDDQETDEKSKAKGELE